MTEHTLVRQDLDAPIAVLTINRPDKLNALNAEVLQALDQALDAIAANPEIRVVILTGAGEKAFVAGADISHLATLSPAEAKAVSEVGQRIFQRIESFSRPVIAAVNGFALGGGCELALACHIRIASNRARFGLPEVGLGTIPGYGGTVRLARVVGLGNAVQMTLTGAPVGADEALRIGLVTQVVEPEALLAEARGMAEQIAGKGPVALREALASIYRAQDVAAADALAFEAERFGALAGTADMKEGMGAFLEKRSPTFRGH
jgi:enoyl-CoA hydratase